MIRTLSIACAAALLMLNAGSAHAQTTSTTTISKGDGPTITLTVTNGDPALTVNGERVKLPNTAEDWERFAYTNDEGELVFVVVRDGNEYSLQFGDQTISAGNPDLALPQIERFLGSDLDMDMDLDWELMMPRAPRPALAPAAPIAPQPRVMIGVRLSNEAPGEIAALGFTPEEATRVVWIAPGGPAERAGLQADDIIVGVAGNKAGNAERLRDVLAKREAGETIELVTVRGDQIIRRELTLAPFDGNAFGVGQNIPEEVVELEVELTDLDDHLSLMKKQLAEARKMIAQAEGDHLVELAEKIRGQSEEIAELSRLRAELSAQLRALTQRDARTQGGQLLLRNGQGRGGEQVLRFPGGEARIFIEGDGDMPFAIVEGLEGMAFDWAEALEGEMPEGVAEMVMGLLESAMDGEFGEMFADIEEDVQELVVEGFDVAEERMDEIEERLEATEERLERIEDLLLQFLDRLDKSDG